MKQNLKSFFSKQRLILAIAFLLIGTLFAHPFTVYSVDSDYLWHNSYWYRPDSAYTGVSFFAEPIENAEWIFFTETGDLYSPDTAMSVVSGELRITSEAFLEKDHPSEKRLSQIIQWSVPPSYRLRTGNAFWYCDYVGVIVKKDGKVVSASLYKMYSIDAHWTGYVEEVAILEFPFLNEFVTETYVKSELRRIEAIDRVLTHNNLLTRLFAPPSISDEVWEDWRPPNSPTYNP